jgi:hypothetical protein
MRYSKSATHPVVSHLVSINQPQNTLIQTIDLANGLVLELYDRSRKLVGDRWQVTLVAAMEIPVEFSGVESCGYDLDQKEGPVELLGKKVVFEKTMNLHFCHEKNKATVLNNMIDSLLTNTLHYFSLPEFPKRFVTKKYLDALRMRTWYPQENKLNDELPPII